MVAPTGARSGWQRRPLLSALLRVGATLVPVAASLGVALALNRVLPSASDTIPAIGRSFGLLLCSLGALVITDALARRFLPLAALLQLSLVFPDQTPSRFKTALKGGSGRRLAREVDLARRDGISDDPSRAAEQLLMLATAIGDHDRRTRGHGERVRLYTELIAEELHISEDERAKLQWAALIHDIGKIEVPTKILNKKGQPDANEWSILQRHPLVGERLVTPVEPWLGDAVHAVGGHHERWDGNGYPRGLAGDAIPRAAAIVAVADAFEVMTAVRSYKAAMPLADARAELTRCAGSHFSPEVVRALLNVSIGRLRRSMGVLAVMAHLPFLGQVTKAAAYAPDTVSTAAGFTTSTATAGVGVLAVTGALAVVPPPVGTDAAPATTSAFEVPAYLQAVPSTETSLPAAPVAVAEIENAAASATVAPSAEVPTTALAPANIEVAITTTTPPTTTPATTPPADTTVSAQDVPTPAADEPLPPVTSAPLPDTTVPPALAATAPAHDDGDDDDDDDDDDDSGNSGHGSSNSGNNSGRGRRR